MNDRSSFTNSSIKSNYYTKKVLKNTCKVNNNNYLTSNINNSVIINNNNNNNKNLNLSSESKVSICSSIIEDSEILNNIIGKDIKNLSNIEITKEIDSLKQENLIFKEKLKKFKDLKNVQQENNNLKNKLKQLSIELNNKKKQFESLKEEKKVNYNEFINNKRKLNDVLHKISALFENNNMINTIEQSNESLNKHKKELIKEYNKSKLYIAELLKDINIKKKKNLELLKSLTSDNGNCNNNNKYTDLVICKLNF